MPDDNERAEEIDLTLEEEEALDNVWDEIHRKKLAEAEDKGSAVPVPPPVES